MLGFGRSLFIITHVPVSLIEVLHQADIEKPKVDALFRFWSHEKRDAASADGPVDADALFPLWNHEKRDPASVNGPALIAARAGRSGYNSADDPPEADPVAI